MLHTYDEPSTAKRLLYQSYECLYPVEAFWSDCAVHIAHI